MEAKERLYQGVRTTEGAAVLVWEDGRAALLPQRQDLRNHSPTGLEWGYGGSGPAQCALAILADALGDDASALALYQRFKWRFVSSHPKEGWIMLRSAIVRWAAAAASSQAREDRTQEGRDDGTE